MRNEDGTYPQSIVIAHNVANEDVVFNWDDKRIIPNPQKVYGVSARDYKWAVTKGEKGNDGNEIGMPPYSSALITEFVE